VSSSRHAGAPVVSVGAGVTLVGTFLTWVRSGSADRSSYDVFDLVDRLGFSEGGIVGWALRLWPLVPLLIVLAVVAWWWPAEGRGWSVWRTTATTLVALYAGGVAIAVANAPEISLFRRGPGPLVTVVGALTMLAGTAVEWITAIHRERRARPSAPVGDRS
jgi:hypothetical protein